MMGEAQDLSLVTLRGVTVTLGERPILNDISLTVKRGELVTFIGPNGAGKTTLVKVILGFLSPHIGQVSRKKGITMGYMPQKIHIDPTLPLSVSRFLSLSQSRGSLTVKEALQIVKAWSLFSAPMEGLSGGELQRILMAKAIMRRPDLLVLDEPVQAVDLPGQGELYALIQEIKSQFGCGVVLISHDLHWVLETSDHVICLNRHICCSGSPQKVSQDPTYQDLFGKIPLPHGLAPYTHVHDHTHDASPDCKDPSHA